MNGRMRERPCRVSTPAARAGSGLPLLADRSPPIHSLDRSPRLGQAPPRDPRRARFQRHPRLVPMCHRLSQSSGCQGGSDRTESDRSRQEGIKYHLLTDRSGLPISVGISGANTMTVKDLSRSSGASHRFARVAGHADAGLRSCTETRGTTILTCVAGYEHGTSRLASRAKARASSALGPRSPVSRPPPRRRWSLRKGAT